MSKLNIKRGKKYWIIPLEEYGTVLKIRQDSNGVDIIDLKIEGDTYVARACELKKQP